MSGGGRLWVERRGGETPGAAGRRRQPVACGGGRGVMASSPAEPSQGGSGFGSASGLRWWRTAARGQAEEGDVTVIEGCDRRLQPSELEEEGDAGA